MPRILHLPISGMKCTSCAVRLEKQLNRQPGLQASVDFAAKSAEIRVEDHGPQLDGILTVIQKTGFAVPTETQHFAITGMRCVACSSRLEKALQTLAGVQAHVNLLQESADITAPRGLVSPDEIISIVRNLGFDAALLPDEVPFAEPAEAERRNLLWATLLSLPLLAGTIPILLGQAPWLPRWLQFLLATPVQFVLGWRFYRGAWNSLRSGGVNMDVLVALGTSMAWIYSTAVWLNGQTQLHVYFEAGAVVITLVLLGKHLETRARRKTHSAIAELMGLQPQTARAERNGQLQEVPVTQLHSDDIVLVRQGETIPVDGVVTYGQALVDESLFTGESSAIIKNKGSVVFAGTTNQEGLLKCRAENVGSQTQLSEIIRLVASAQSSKAPIQHLADKIAGIIVPAVISIALLTFILTWVWLDFSLALIHAVAVLVIACPCTLGLAAPAAITVGVGLGARHGILFRNARALEATSNIQTLVLDKTGTLTLGLPEVVAILPEPGWNEPTLLQLAASLEASSEHPLARAVQARASGVVRLKVEEFRVEPGLGVSGKIGGISIRIGVPHWAAPDVHSENQDWPQHTLLAVAVEGVIAGRIACADITRPGAQATVARLKAMGIRVVMLTGDSPEVAAALARTVGIEHYQARTSSREKARIVTELKTGGRHVAMVGDSINDALALAAADTSFTLGVRGEVAAAAADVTLMHEDLTRIAAAIDLSRATLVKIRQNLFFAYVYNMLGIPLAALGLLNPVIAGAAMALSSVSVITNALLLRQWKFDPR